MALKLNINLRKILGDITSDRQKLARYTKAISSQGVKREYGERYIDEILNRLDDGKGKDGSLKSYSKAYKKSFAYQAYNKSSTVNLKLTGDMRADINVVGTSATSVTIGFTDKEQEAKAIGHIKGRGNLPKRDFWGLPKKEEENLLKEMIREFEANNVSFEEEPPKSRTARTEREAVQALSVTTNNDDLIFFLDDLEDFE